jgi:predicted tellurium resistance membrane protein TerC
MDWITDPQIWIAFGTLTSLEIVLGIDNIVFISILSGRLPESQQARARTVGLALAMVTRILLLLVLAWVIGLVAPLFTVLGEEISGRDIILIAGGLFLVAKSTYEIHHKLEGEHSDPALRSYPTFAAVIIQILLLDLVFSLDSVITAVGMVDELGVMIAAVVVAVLVMLVAAGPISRFVERHPTIKMLALSFLLLIGVTLMLEGLDQHVPKGYIYFAMAFSLFVELLNLRIGKTPGKPAPVRLREGHGMEGSAGPEPEPDPEPTA